MQFVRVVNFWGSRYQSVGSYQDKQMLRTDVGFVFNRSMEKCFELSLEVHAVYASFVA